MKFINLDKAFDLSTKEIEKLYWNNVNPGLMSVFKILGFSNMDIDFAKGSYIYMKDGSKVLDMTSGIGVLNLGHNHPRILEAERKYSKKNKIDILKFGVNPLQAVLAHNLGLLLPGDLRYSFFSTSGAEAIEAALKLVTRASSNKRKYFVRMSNSYHGKTHGALSLTDAESFSKGFHTSVPIEKVLTVKYGCFNELKDIILKHEDEIIAVVVEPIQGQSLEVPEKGYLKKLVELCKENKIYTVFDEIKVGMGRTGKLFSFEHEENVIPDVVTISKSLGGGRRAIGAMVTTEEIFKKAYGKKKDSTLHTTTFQGIGSSCAVAIEALDIISQTKFLESVNQKSDFLYERLEELRIKYPQKIKSILGKGLFLGLELDFSKLDKLKEVKLPFIKETEIILTGSLTRELYKRYQIMTCFSGTKNNVIYIMPPLTATEEELQYFVESLDELFNRFYSQLIAKFLVNAI